MTSFYGLSFPLGLFKYVGENFFITPTKGGIIMGWVGGVLSPLGGFPRAVPMGNGGEIVVKNNVYG
jgi:hypothetical protein